MESACFSRDRLTAVSSNIPNPFAQVTRFAARGRRAIRRNCAILRRVICDGADHTTGAVVTEAEASGFLPKGASVTITFGPFTLDDGARHLCRGVESIHLSPKAFDLLALLAQRRPEAIAKSEILDTLWRDTFVSEGNLAVLVKEIRDALGDSAQRPAFIRTVQRFGYAFLATATTRDAARAAAPCWVTWGTRRATLLVGQNVLGRDPSSDVLIDMLGVSRRHALIAVANEEITLADLRSKNGTFANGERVTVPVPLADDVEIRLGPVPLRFRRLPQGTSTQTFDASRLSRNSP